MRLGGGRGGEGMGYVGPERQGEKVCTRQDHGETLPPYGKLAGGHEMDLP